MVLRSGLLLIVLWVVLLLLIQSRLIYHPRKYPAAVLDHLGHVQRIRFVTSQGAQVAYLMPPRTTSLSSCSRFWLVFSGNAALALDWVQTMQELPDDHAAYLLVEYPGYGECSGRPSPDAILESTESGLAAVAGQFHASLDSLGDRMAVLGHSLGCAAALQFAAKHPVRDIVLFAPFTTMLAMARRTVGWPSCELLMHRFDNEARLTDILSHGTPHITIIHGDRDQSVPVEMGRRLAAEHPRAITLKVIPGAHHTDIVERSWSDLVAVMGR